MTQDILTYDDAVTQRAVVASSAQVLRDRLLDTQESDEWTEAKANAFMVDGTRLTAMDSQLSELDRKIAILTPNKTPEAVHTLQGLRMFMDEGWTNNVVKKQGKEFVEKHMGAEATSGNRTGNSFVIKADLSTLSTGSNNVAAAVPTTTLGGYVNRLKAYGGVGQVASSFMTETGEDIKMTNIDNTTQKGSIVVEGGDVPQLDPSSFKSTTLGAYRYTSGYVPASRKALRDVNLNLEALIYMQLIERLGRVFADHQTTGDNSAKPQGIQAVAKAGVTAASETAITVGELLDVQEDVHSYLQGNPILGQIQGASFTLGVPAAYLMSANAWYKVRGLTDTTGRPIWQISVREGAPNTLFEYPVYISHELPAVGTSSVSVLFGNFQGYMIRSVNEVELVRFYDSGTGLKDSVYFLAFAEMDARAIGPFDSTSLDSVAKITQAA